MSYNPNIPLPTDYLADSQGQIKTNFTQLNNVYNVDHSPYTSATDIGYHKDIHVIKRTGNPTNVADKQIIFTKDYTPDSTGATADTQLFTLTGANIVSQLSGRLAGTDGWAWVGGILLQWGRKTGFSGSWPTSAQTLTFKDRVTGAIPFPNNCYAVLTTFIGPTSSSSGDISINSQTSTNFIWQFSGNSSAAFDGFFWIAVGN